MGCLPCSGSALSAGTSRVSAPRTSNAGTGWALPFSISGSTATVSKTVPASRAVSSPSRMPPGSAAVWRGAGGVSTARKAGDLEAGGRVDDVTEDGVFAVAADIANPGDHLAAVDADAELELERVALAVELA